MSDFSGIVGFVIFLVVLNILSRLLCHIQSGAHKREPRISEDRGTEPVEGTDTTSKWASIGNEEVEIGKPGMESSLVDMEEGERMERMQASSSPMLEDLEPEPEYISYEAETEPALDEERLEASSEHESEAGAKTLTEEEMRGEIAEEVPPMIRKDEGSSGAHIRPRSISVSELLIDKEDLKRAIVLREILGPCRARRMFIRRPAR